MKKLILILAVTPFMGISQMKVSTIEEPKNLSWVNEVFLNKDSSNYFLCYHNYKYLASKPTVCITIPDTENNIENLYNEIKYGFKNFSENTKKIEIAGQTILLKYSKMMGVVTVNIMQESDGNILSYSQELREKNIEKLFLKNKKK